MGLIIDRSISCGNETEEDYYELGPEYFVLFGR